ncbi:aldo/keto reductase [Rubrobacter xylanophilus DSM 9941]|uniref:Aldo/keto reductase n=1 Tax=Rubrobacter xylanophilus (strain DSM 9941 / JCM 11954 / NBRC 16129 / PRD-1) TaxID=266117 RepID=Q1AY12_RUBXD|nr:aldo/keto reductase [Rubrobacter xylanophilus]ABG03716.1 aldo/keto reductase [Rubrobacter xylanophilus DSM 9941]
MRYRRLAGTDIEVSEVGFGVWTITTGWWGEVDDARSLRLLRRAHELGINYYDTADTYGSGKGETILAEAFRGMRDEVVISTKIGYDFYNHTERRGQQERPQDWSEGFIRFALEQSLRRLETDYIDFLQLHNAKMDAIENDRLFELLEEFKREGKVRAYGVALGPKIGWRDEGVRAMRERDIDGLQMIYNILEQDPGRDLIEAARETGTSLIVRVPHSSGMLEGRYDENTTFAKNDHRRHRPRQWLLDGLKKVEQLGFLTESGERTLGQAALKFCLATPEVVSTLPNIYGEEQLEEFAAAPDTPDLTPQELERIAGLYADNFGLETAARR